MPNRLPIARLLQLLEAENRRTGGGRLPSAREKVRSARVPTLDGGMRPMTPQLRERFAYDGARNDAVLGQRWLSLSEMADRLSLVAVDAQKGDALDCELDFIVFAVDVSGESGRAAAAGAAPKDVVRTSRRGGLQ